MRVSIVRDPEAAYPPPGEGFSPSEDYPEAAFPERASGPNPVYPLVRRLLAQAGLDAARFGRAEWNPLGDYLRPGQRVFVLCNFVYHRRARESELDFQGKCIHGSVLRAVVDHVLRAVGPAGRVTFGNAPLQSCRWERVQAETGAAEVEAFYARHGAPVASRDLRLLVSERDALGRVVREERRDERDGVEIDLADASLLARPAPGLPPPRYRVLDYDPARIEAFHRGGRHVYVLHREVLEADAVVSLSKLKTHEKVGITCGLKGFVGAVAHKDSLAHHRFGSPAEGGDEYPRGWVFRPWLSSFHDRVQARRGGALQGTLMAVDRNVRRALQRAGFVGGGAWHGNDTAWRMTRDLARLLHHADAAGRLHAERRRVHLSFVDGIVGGEGEGPLDPRGVRSGVLLFADDVAAGDRAACRLIGYDPAGMALLRDVPPCRAVLDGAEVPEEAIPPALGRPFAPPRGWAARLVPA